MKTWGPAGPKISFWKLSTVKYLSKVSWQSVASLDSRLDSCIESRRTENKRFTHEWFLNNSTKTYRCNTKRHGYIRASDCMLETRPIQVIKQMILQGHLYQASFPQQKSQIPAPNENKQCIAHIQATAFYFVPSNDSGLMWLRGLIKISYNIRVCP